ncbi:MAG: hypothetical protein MJ247_06920 [Alphaproteobacteria bacterium]|nr:hypothetical protein [Alphaproteobacteria bacterium]
MISTIATISISVALSVIWMVLISFNIFAKVGLAKFFSLSISEIATCATTMFAPVFGLWLIVGIVWMALQMRKQHDATMVLTKQMRMSAEHGEAMVRTLMETQQQARSAAVLRNADLFIYELNDLLCDILQRLTLLKPSQADTFWQRIGAGNRWAFCKMLLDTAERSPHFTENIAVQMERDEILSSYIRLFCYRFEQMYTVLERHDFEHYLTKIFEEGSLGRVYNRFLTICRTLDEAKAEYEKQQEQLAKEQNNIPEPVEVIEEEQKPQEENQEENLEEFDVNEEDMNNLSQGLASNVYNSSTIDNVLPHVPTAAPVQPKPAPSEEAYVQEQETSEDKNENYYPDPEPSEEEPQEPINEIPSFDKFTQEQALAMQQQQVTTQPTEEVVQAAPVQAQPAPVQQQVQSPLGFLRPTR